MDKIIQIKIHFKILCKKTVKLEDKAYENQNTEENRLWC